MTSFNPKKVDKDWGYELWLANNENENYCGKILFIEQGKSTSMHYHLEKHETFHVVEGFLSVDMLQDKDEPDHQPLTITCEEGKSMEMERGRAHKLRASKGHVTLIEVSNFHRDEDSHRLYR